MSKEIIAKQNSTVSIETVLQQAIAKGVPPETMVQIMAMRRELKAEYAKEQFDTDMAAFQLACPIIKKSKSIYTNAGAKAYSYVPLESIIEQIKKLLQEHGFSYSIQTKTLGNKEVEATCIAKHISGHSETSSIQIPIGTKTNIMSDTQVVAAALTFAKRYAFCNVFGILTGDMDTNAPIPQPEGNLRTEHNKAATRMSACTSVDSLNKVWLSLSAKIRKDDELIALGKQIKKSLTK